MEVQGTIKLIGKTETFGDKGFKKRQTVITTDEQYPQDVAIDFVQDKTSLLDAFEVGQSAKIGINIRGNEYNGKYYVNLQGWKIDKVEGSATAAPFEPAPEPANPEEEEDDLPF